MTTWTRAGTWLAQSLTVLVVILLAVSAAVLVGYVLLWLITIATLPSTG